MADHPTDTAAGGENVKYIRRLLAAWLIRSAHKVASEDAAWTRNYAAEIMKYLRKRYPQSVTAQELATILGVPTKTARGPICRLAKAGRLIRVGLGEYQYNPKDSE